MRITTVVLFLIALSGSLPAATIAYDPSPTADTGWKHCGSLIGDYCDTAAYFDPDSLSGISLLFQTAFSDWNSSVGGTWTLTSGGALAGTLNVTRAIALEASGNELGGVSINVSVNGITNLPPVGANQSLVWVQALYDNYSVNGSIVDPQYEIDNLGSNTSPAYPAPYTLFQDTPTEVYGPPGSIQAFFQANTYLALEDTSNNMLTIYDGISYGFQNNVSTTPSPEPSAWKLCIGGILAAILIRRKRLVS